MLKQIVAGVVVAVMLAGAAGAGPLEDADAAYQRGDYATAARLFRPLAEQGLAAAQSMLGIMYAEGWGVPQDFVEAVKWHRLAAEQGNVDAQYGLGFRYWAGRGVPQDYVLAHMWWNLAAAQGDDIAAGARDNLASQMTADQIAEAQRLARAWKPTTPQPPDLIREDDQH